MSDEKPDAASSDRRERLRRALRHDLRNPLAVVLGRCEMLLSGALGDLDQRQLRSVEIIQRNAERVVEMLGEMAELASDDDV